MISIEVDIAWHVLLTQGVWIAKIRNREEKFLEVQFRLSLRRIQRVTQNAPVLLFHGNPILGRPLLKLADDFFLNFTNNQLSHAITMLSQ